MSVDDEMNFQCVVLKVYTSYSSLAQSVERMTVNHDVVGSSPTRGAKIERF